MATRKQIGEAFKAAKELTARNGKECYYTPNQRDRKYEFICHALNVLQMAYPGAIGAMGVINDRFKSAANGQVRSSPTIFVWLADVGGVPVSQLTDDRVQAYKHRWLDSVIKEFGG
jgi:hypothetical protein